MSLFNKIKGIFKKNQAVDIVATKPEIDVTQHIFRPANTVKYIQVVEKSEGDNLPKPQPEKSNLPPLKSNGQYSLYKGISYDRKYHKWVANYYHGYKTNNIGRYDTEAEAIKAREEYVRKVESGEIHLDTRKVQKRNANAHGIYKRGNKFIVNYKSKYIGVFNTREEAEKARDYVITTEDYTRFRQKKVKQNGVATPPKNEFGRYSDYLNVSFLLSNSMWYSYYYDIDGKKQMIGYYLSEAEAVKGKREYFKEHGMEDRKKFEIHFKDNKYIARRNIDGKLVTVGKFNKRSEAVQSVYGDGLKPSPRSENWTLENGFLYYKGEHTSIKPRVADEIINVYANSTHKDECIHKLQREYNNILPRFVELVATCNNDNLSDVMKPYYNELRQVQKIENPNLRTKF